MKEERIVCYMHLQSLFNRLRQSLHRYLRAHVDLLFPRSCVHCTLPVDDPHWQYLCKNCARQLFLCHEPSCHYCGQPFYGSLSGSRTCPNCSELVPQFSEGKSLFLAKDVGRSLIHELKYAQGFYVLKDIKALIEKSAYWRNYFADTILVAVPLHRTKFRQRGYNQSEKIAKCIVECFPTRTQIQTPLRRVGYTKTQTKLNREQRRQNIKNAFALRPDAVLDQNFCYVLVDDVFTTGVTLNACATVLHAAGAQKIKTFTLGHG